MSENRNPNKIIDNLSIHEFDSDNRSIQSRNIQSLADKDFFDLALPIDPFQYDQQSFDSRMFNSSYSLDSYNDNAVNTPIQSPLRDYWGQAYIAARQPQVQQNHVQQNHIQQNISNNVVHQINNQTFNGMPADIISVVQQLAKHVAYDRNQIKDFDMFKFQGQIQQCLQMMKQKVLYQFNSKDRTKNLLRLIFNKKDQKLINKLKAKKQLTQAEQNYLKIQKKFSDCVFNQVKQQLRSQMGIIMNQRSNYYEAIKRFPQNNQEIRRIVFEKYLNNFRDQLISGQILAGINRQQILNTPIFNQGERGLIGISFIIQP